MRSSILLSAAALLSAGTARADIVFSDSTFPDSNWPAPQITGSGSSSSTQIQSGGNPNEARQITTTVSDNSPSGVFAFHQFGSTAATIYTPSTSGPITSLVVSFDYLAVTGQQFLAFGLKQSNIFYYAGVVQTTNSGGYLTNSVTLTAADFLRADALAGVPNFVNGQSIRFGIMSIESTGPGGVGFTSVADVDNWSVRIVPAPGALALAALGFIRRRRS